MRKFTLHTLLAASFGLTFMLTSGSAVAGNFHVSPIRLDIGPVATSGVLTIRNDSPEDTVVVQAKLLKWSQSAGEDVTVPTTELIVNPPIFTLKPGGQQLIRIGSRESRLVDNGSELSYRIVLAEVPQVRGPDFRGVNVALQVSIPIFFSPTLGLSVAAPQITVDRNADGEVIARVENRSPKSLKINQASLLDRATKTQLADVSRTRYVLANSTAVLTFKGAVPVPSSFTLQLVADSGVYTLDVTESRVPALPTPATATGTVTSPVGAVSPK